MKNLSEFKSEYKNLHPHLSQEQQAVLDKYSRGSDNWTMVKYTAIAVLFGGLVYLTIIS